MRDAMAEFCDIEAVNEQAFADQDARIRHAVGNTGSDQPLGRRPQNFGQYLGIAAHEASESFCA